LRRRRPRPPPTRWSRASRASCAAAATARRCGRSYARDEALRIIAAYQEPEAPAVAVEPRAGIGCAATEAPRGMLWHRYRLEADGAIAEARIVPPTSQNQPSIEDDLRACVTKSLDLDDEALRLRCEQTIRNHDPCISCSTHFLRLEIDRGTDA
jgi:coenzyme F420-reducing hydrogenase alpha subunit